MRIFFGGIATETNTFSPLPTGLADFSVRRADGSGEAPQLDAIADVLAQRCAAQGHTLVRGLSAYAAPAGVTVRAVYEQLRDELLADLREAQRGGLDAVFLWLHGAMVADGYDDCEADLAARVRALVGPRVAVGAELDLHCHIDQRLLQPLDAIVIYKEYPHVDVAERAFELLDLLTRSAHREIQPVMALHDCRMVGLYSTVREPMRGFVREMCAAESRPGVLSVSLAHGFPYGDVAHAGAKLLVVADGDAALASRVAAELAERLWQLREQIGVSPLPLDQAMARAVASTRRPTVVADQSDNAGGGAPADSTHALRWLLEHQVRGAGLAILHDPEAVKIAFSAGAGARLPLRLGGKTGPASGDPVDVMAQVLALRREYVHELPQENAAGLPMPIGDAVALDCAGVIVIVGSRRCQCFSPKIFADFGVGELDIYVPKSTLHFMSGFGPIAGEVILMGAPGALNPRIAEIPYRHMPTAGKHPWTAL